MKVLVVGASGATGHLLVRALLQRGLWVIALVRSARRMPDDLRQQERLTIVEATVLELDDRQLAAVSEPPRDEHHGVGDQELTE